MDGIGRKMDEEYEAHLKQREMDLIIGEMNLIRNKTQREHTYPIQ